MERGVIMLYIAAKPRRVDDTIVEWNIQDAFEM